MSEHQGHDPNTSSSRHYPLLNSAEIQALHELPNHGVNVADEIKRFSSFEEWRARGGAGNNFWMRFKPDFLDGMHREPQWIQRFTTLYPDLDARLVQAAEPFGPNHPFDEATDRLFLDAYDKMADLVDRGDVGVTNGRRDGQVEPNLLLE